MPKLKKIASSSNYHILPPSSAMPQQVFFDGVSSMTVGAANCKLDFHQIVGRDEQTQEEQRKIVITAIIPTASLVELCQNVLASLNQNEAGIRDALTQQASKILSALISKSTEKFEEKV